VLAFNLWRLIFVIIIVVNWNAIVLTLVLIIVVVIVVVEWETGTKRIGVVVVVERKARTKGIRVVVVVEGKAITERLLQVAIEVAHLLLESFLLTLKIQIQLPHFFVELFLFFWRQLAASVGDVLSSAVFHANPAVTICIRVPTERRARIRVRIRFIVLFALQSAAIVVKAFGDCSHRLLVIGQRLARYDTLECVCRTN